MRSSYKALGKYIRVVDERNTTLEDLPLMGLSVSKAFFPTIANLVGTDMSTYKVVYRNQFTYIADTSRRGDKIAIALNDMFDKMLVSQAYTPFEIIDIEELDPEYLMMWFRRPEFDRYARFKSHGSAREIFDWEEMCNILLPIPSISKQREIVKEYHVLQNRIALNQQLIQKLEETAQAIYTEWFVKFEYPDNNGKPYKSSGGEMVWSEMFGEEIPRGWEVCELGNLVTHKKGFAFSSENYRSNGIPVFRVSDFTDKSIDISNCHFLDELLAKDLVQYKLNTNDIIITTVGSWPDNPQSIVGKVIIAPELSNKGLLNQNAVRLRAQKPSEQIFIYYRLLCKDYSEFVISGAQGSANQASVTLAHILSFKIVVPNQCDKLFLGLNKMNDTTLKIITENYYLSKMSKLLLSKLATIESHLIESSTKQNTEVIVSID